MRIGILSILFLLSWEVHAVCSGPAGAEGALNYVSGLKTYQVCDGTSWQSLSTSSGGGLTVSSQTANFTVAAPGDMLKMFLVDGASGTVDITLPSAVTAGANFQFTTKMTGTELVRILGLGAETIDGSNNFYMTAQNSTISLISDGANWQISNFYGAAGGSGENTGTTGKSNIYDVTNLTAERFYAIETDSEGNIYAVGRSNTDMFVRKYDYTGSTTWSQTYHISGTDEGYGSFLDVNGKLVVCGRANSQMGFWRINTNDGSLDTSFATVGYVQWEPASSNGTDYAWDCEGDASGNIYAVGESNSSGLGRELTVVKINNAGTVFTDNKPTGSTNNDYLYGMTLDGSGNIIAVGQYRNSTDDIVVVKFNGSTLAVDTSFGTSGYYFYDGSQANVDTAYDVKLDSSGRIVVFGYVDNATTREECYVTRLTTAGALDTSFGTSGHINAGTHTADRCYGGTIDEEGNIYAVGVEANGTDGVGVWKFDSSGSAITSFGTSGLYKYTAPTGNAWANDAVVDFFGKLLIAGETTANGDEALFLEVE